MKIAGTGKTEIKRAAYLLAGTARALADELTEDDDPDLDEAWRLLCRMRRNANGLERAMRRRLEGDG